MRTQARFPEVAPEAGHYESFYLKASAPEGGRALWIRHTIHKRPGAEPTCAVWMTYFDEKQGAPRAAKQQFGAESLRIPNDSYVRVGDSEIGSGWVRGNVAANDVKARWGLRFTDRHEPLRHLPFKWMYNAKLPRTKLLSPHPGALFDGTFDIGDERVEIAAWPGMVGHNWGAEHAERWVWIHGTGLEGGAETDFLDIAAGRVKLGPIRTPWIANGAICIDGRRHRLGGLGRRSRIEAEARGCRFSIGGRGIRVDGTVGADREQFVAWLYSDPLGGSHHALNCSISDLDVTVKRPGEPDARRRLRRAAAYELGSHDTDHGVPLQPFDDG
jgi:hypothetical protein